MTWINVDESNDDDNGEGGEERGEIIDRMRMRVRT